MIARHQTEKQFMAAIVDYAKINGWLCYHTHDSRRSAPGFPDLVLCKPPRQVVAELKNKKDILSWAQRRRLADLTQCSRIDVHVWWPGDWPEIETTLGVDIGSKVRAAGRLT